MLLRPTQTSVCEHTRPTINILALLTCSFLRTKALRAVDGFFLYAQLESTGPQVRWIQAVRPINPNACGQRT